MSTLLFPIPVQIVKITELRSKTGEVLGRVVRGSIPGAPPEGLASLGGLSLFVPQSEPFDLVVGQVVSLGVTTREG